MDNFKVLIVGDSRVETLKSYWIPLHSIELNFKSKSGARMETICFMIEEAVREVKPARYDLIVIVGVTCDIVRKVKSDAGVHDACMQVMDDSVYPGLNGVRQLVERLHTRCEVASPGVKVNWVFPYPSDIKTFICSKNRVEVTKIPMSYAKHLDLVTFESLKYFEKLEGAFRAVLKSEDCISWFPLWKCGDLNDTFRKFKQAVREKKIACSLAPEMTRDGVHPTGALGAPLLRQIGEIVGRIRSERRRNMVAPTPTEPIMRGVEPIHPEQKVLQSEVSKNITRSAAENTPQTEVNNNIPHSAVREDKCMEVRDVETPQVELQQFSDSRQGQMVSEVVQCENAAYHGNKRVKRHSRSDSEEKVRSTVRLPLNYPVRSSLMIKSAPTRLDHELARKRN